MQALSEFIEAHPGQPDAYFADLFGVSRSHFNMIRNGTAQPSKKVMRRIAEVTNGAVPIMAWFQEAAE